MKIRQEIDLIYFRGTTGSGGAYDGSASGFISQMNTNDYSGGVTYTFEITATAITGKTSGSIRLKRYDTGADVATIARTALTIDTATIQQTTFTPPVSGELQYYVYIDAVAGEQTNIGAARIVIRQSESTATVGISNTLTQITIAGYGSDVGTGTQPAGMNLFYFHYDSADWNTESMTVLLEGVIKGSSTKTGTTLKLQVSNATDSFTGWADVTNGTLTILGTAYALGRTATGVTLISGRNYRVILTGPTTKATVYVAGAKLLIYSAASAQVMKVAPQYSLDHYYFTSIIDGLELGYWDPADWDSNTTFKAYVNTSASVTGVSGLYGGTAGQLTTVTNPANGTFSAAVTMPGSVDTLYLSSVSGVNNSVSAFKLIAYAVNSASSSAIKTINGLAKASIKTINGLAIASVKNRNGLA